MILSILDRLLSAYCDCMVDMGEVCMSPIPAWASHVGAHLFAFEAAVRMMNFNNFCDTEVIVDATINCKEGSVSKIV